MMKTRKDAIGRKKRQSPRQKQLSEYGVQLPPDRVVNSRVRSTYSIICAVETKRCGAGRQPSFQERALYYVKRNFPPALETPRTLAIVERWLRDPGNREPPTVDSVQSRKPRTSRSPKRGKIAYAGKAK